MEKTFAVQPIGIKFKCDTCSKGEMLPTGINNWSLEPPTFEHICDNCGRVENTSRSTHLSDL